MGLVDEIRSDIHGEQIDLWCDLKHERYAPTVASESVLMDVIRVDNVSNFEQLCSPPDGWVTDVLRCEDHITETVPLPTDGYEEALVWVDTVADVPPGSRTAIDASELVVVDHSPSTHGADPPVVDAELCLRAANQGDYGFPRVGRQRAILPRYRAQEKDIIVEMVERQAARARDTGRGENTA